MTESVDTQAINFTMKFYRLSREQAIKFCQDEVESYLELRLLGAN